MPLPPPLLLLPPTLETRYATGRPQGSAHGQTAFDCKRFQPHNQVGIPAVCPPYCTFLQTHFLPLIGRYASMPFPMEAVFNAGGVGMVQEEDELDIDGTQTGCAATML